MEKESEILKRHLRDKSGYGGVGIPDISQISSSQALNSSDRAAESITADWKYAEIPQRQLSLADCPSSQPSINVSEETGPQKFQIKRFGDQDCGWDVIPGLLGKESVIYCVGCGENISFDMDLMKYLDFKLYAFDPTPKSLKYLRSLDLPVEYHIFKYGLAHYDGSAEFNPPVNPAHVSHTLCDRAATADRAITVPMKRLKTIMQELGHDRIDLLKMDIEGAEYAVIDDLVKNKIPIGQICVEFHHFFDGNKIEHTLQTIIRLIQCGYMLYSVHHHTDYCFVWKPLLAVLSRGNGAEGMLDKAELRNLVRGGEY
jgi:FkbM family methyltransferase